MLRRLILVGTTLACVLLGLFLYQQGTDTGITEKPPEPSSPASTKPVSQTTPTSSDSVEAITLQEGVSVGEITGAKFTTRDRDNQRRIISEFGFKKRRVNAAGQHELVSPWIKFYKTNQLIKITANALTSPVETRGQLPESGWLEGQVQIELFSKANDLAGSILETPEHRTMLVELERVNFQREFSRIHSPGTVKITSASFNALGSQLTIQYDQLHDSLAELELRHLEYMEYVSNRLDKPAQNTDRSNEKTTTQTEATSEKPAKAYRLSLVDNVVIHQKDNRVEADRIEILANGLINRGNQKDVEPRSDSQAKENSPETNESAPTVTRLTCTGPLRIVPAATEEQPEPSQNLQVHIFGKPIKIWQQDQLSLVASDMIYYPGSETLDLKGSEDQPIRLMLEANQWASATHSARWHQKSGLVILSGPGEIVSKSKKSDQPFHVKYQDNLELQLDDHQQIKSIKLNGQVWAKSENLEFTSKKLIAEFEQDDSGRSSPKFVRAEGLAKVETPEYILEAEEKLEITFEPQVKHNNSSPDVSETNDSESNFMFGEKNTVYSVLATGANGQVRMTHKQQQMRIVGDRLEGNSSQQVWTIRGQKARIENLSAKRNFQTLESSLIIANLQQGRYEVPGQGFLTALIQDTQQGDPLNQEAPVTIHWKKSATYSLQDNRIVLKDVFITMRKQNETTESQTEITTAELSIRLKGKSELNTSEKNRNIGQFSTLIAHGPIVHMVRREINRITAEPVSLMEMQSTRLQYDNNTNTLLAHGEGWVEITDFVGSESTSLDNKGRLLSSKTPMYSLIRFNRDLRYHTVNREIILTGHVMVDQIPLVTLINKEHAGISKIDGIKQLTCDSLKIAFSDSSDENTTASPSSALGKNIGRLDSLSAKGNIFFETLLNNRHHIFSADSLHFEKETNLATFTGNEQSPVKFNQIRFSQIKINLQTGDIDTKPVGHSEIANQF